MPGDANLPVLDKFAVGAPCLLARATIFRYDSPWSIARTRRPLRGYAAWRNYYVRGASKDLVGYLASPTLPWKPLIVGLSLGKFMFESYITLRQCRVLCKPRPPTVLEKEINPETFAKTQAYGLAKARFSLASGVWYTAIKYLYLKHDVLTKFWHFSGDMILKYAPSSWAGTVGQSIVFATVYLMANMIETIPLQLYQTFVIEQKFGFNKQSLGGFVMDQIKTFFISTTFLIPAVAGFLYITNKAGDKCALYLGLGSLGLRFFIMTVYPVFILPMFFKLSPLISGDYRDGIQALAKKLSFPLSKLYLADGSSRSTHSNAFFFGFPWQKNIVVFDTLIAQMNPGEVSAVVAHELGHWKLGHTAWLFVLQQFDLIYSFGLFSLIYSNPNFYSSFGLGREQPVIVGFLLFCQVLPPLSSAQQLLNNVFSRKYEYEADAFAKSLGLRSELSTALLKLNLNNLSTIDADAVYSSYHHSHPLLAERLAALQ
ncbi:hypothetical protein NLG97_g2496 [Lecanicillium saksenae]|uniref:Uncharacterized protein n=1 Tax=Lecanicillium saksenae TaxID=468837 RepID=A0ACC1R0R5_9HYPO|nr:hypothetical protein NLG97_g2496 [Lecanicillium saksenae]